MVVRLPFTFMVTVEHVWLALDEPKKLSLAIPFIKLEVDEKEVKPAVGEQLIKREEKTQIITLMYIFTGSPSAQKEHQC